MNKKRLLTLAAALILVPPENFNMEVWANGDDDDTSVALCKPGATPTTCGTVACAAGWCPAVFPKDWKYKRTSYCNVGVELKRNGSGDTLRDAADYFDITCREAELLFTPSHLSDWFGITPKKQASRIRQFIACKEDQAMKIRTNKAEQKRLRKRLKKMYTKINQIERRMPKLDDDVNIRMEGILV